MRKSNWIVFGILLVASIIFLWMWFFFEFNFVDNPVDIVITVIWWVVIIALCVIITVVERRRQRSVRTTFIAPDLLYNSEAGIVRLKDGEDYVIALQKLLSNLSYSFEVAKVPEDSRIRFKCIVRSSVFSDNGRNWKGEVVKVSNPDDTKAFSNMRELSKLLDSMS